MFHVRLCVYMCPRARKKAKYVKEIIRQFVIVNLQFVHMCICSKLNQNEKQTYDTQFLRITRAPCNVMHVEDGEDD